MAFDSWGKFNRETSVPLTVEYTKEPFRTGTNGVPYSYKYTRHVTKSFTYKGLSVAAAKACAGEMRRKYTRPFVEWTHGLTTSIPKSEMADRYRSVAAVNVVRREVVFDVQVTVDESIEIYIRNSYDIRKEGDCKRLENEFLHGRWGSVWYTRIHRAAFDYDEN